MLARVSFVPAIARGADPADDDVVALFADGAPRLEVEELPDQA